MGIDARKVNICMDVCIYGCLSWDLATHSCTTFNGGLVKPFMLIQLHIRVLNSLCRFKSSLVAGEAHIAPSKYVILLFSFPKAFSRHCFRPLTQPVIFQINEACITRPEWVYTVPGDTSASLCVTALLGSMVFKVRFHINRMLLRLHLGVVIAQYEYNVLFFMRTQRQSACSLTVYADGQAPLIAVVTNSESPIYIHRYTTILVLLESGSKGLKLYERICIIISKVWKKHIWTKWNYGTNEHWMTVPLKWLSLLPLLLFHEIVVGGRDVLHPYMYNMFIWQFCWEKSLI